MPADTPTAGYPVHAVATFSRGCNEWGAAWVDWVAQCGATGTQMGARTGGDFLRAGSCRSRELCPSCFPGGRHNACRIDKPRDITPA